jgi:hypothetical protein
MNLADIPPSVPKTTRREFGKALGGLAAPLVAASSLEAQAEKKPSQPATSSPSPAQTLFELIRQKYAKYLTSDQLDEVRKRVERNQSRTENLRGFKLSNGDEPAFCFRA